MAGPTPLGILITLKYHIQYLTYDYRYVSHGHKYYSIFDIFIKFPHTPANAVESYYHPVHRTPLFHWQSWNCQLVMSHTNHVTCIHFKNSIALIMRRSADFTNTFYLHHI